ncbi:C2 domain-containing protein 3 [Bagarius yarrelli]|uniref:C2 domain-containing protein 3 n=1 Tax=Bagarius yarrelli TaxID=175774 RepID=A0A556V007_BAGYA|nr:C2 domain-containing protein 3 [Bagarius yarrelli]
MLRRPKPTDSESDLLQEQERFLVSGSAPAAAVTRRADKRRGDGASADSDDSDVKTRDVVTITDLPDELPTLTPGPAKKSCSKKEHVRFENEDPEELLDKHDTHISAVLSRIVERDTSAVPVLLPAFTSTAFPKVLHCSTVKNQEIGGRKSIFARHIAAEKAKTGCGERNDSKVANTLASNFRPAQDTTGPLLVSGQGLGPDSALETLKIHQENQARLKGMSQSEILEEQKFLLAQLDPRLVDFVKSRKAGNAAFSTSSSIDKSTCPDQSLAKSKPPDLNYSAPDHQEVTMDTEVDDETQCSSHRPINVEQLLIKPEKGWLHMDKLEPEKLEWMSELPPPRKKGTKQAMQARFDFSGILIPPTEDLPTHLGLHHHGEDPELHKEDDDEDDEGQKETEKQKEERQLDHDIAQKDVIKGLLKMQLLQRLRYILEVVRPSPQTVLDILEILIRIARYSVSAATQVNFNRVLKVILDCPRLMETVMSDFLPCVWSVMTSPTPPSLYGFPVSKAIKLLRVLGSASRHVCARILNNLGGKERLSRFLSVKPSELLLESRENICCSTEALRLWAVAASYGQACNLYKDLYPVLIEALQAAHKPCAPSESLIDLELHRVKVSASVAHSGKKCGEARVGSEERGGARGRSEEHGGAGGGNEEHGRARGGNEERSGARGGSEDYQAAEFPDNATSNNSTSIIIKVCVVIPLFCVFLYCILLMLHTFASHRQFLDSSRYILFAYMLVNDTLQLLTSVLLFLFVMGNVKFAIIFCAPLLFVSVATFQNGPLILAAMSLERYVAIFYPLHRPSFWKPERIWVIVLSLWTISCIPPTVDFILMRPNVGWNVFTTPLICKTTVLNGLPIQTLFKVAVNALFFAVVAAIILFTYIRILLETRKMRQDRASVTKALHTVVLHGFQLLLSLMVFTFPITENLMVLNIKWLPEHIQFINYFCFVLLPRFLSPLIYGLRDECLRSYMKKAIPCCKVCIGSHKILKVVSDVTPSTSIPPLVEGHVRCFLRVTLSKVLWTISKPPPHTLIRLRWWGETTSGTVFCPRDGSLDREKDVKSTARFSVRCGPKQFASYLTDMGSLTLDVLKKPDHLAIARIQIPGIAKLSSSHSISGSFTLVSPVSEKLGELQATLALEPLTELYDSSSPVPTVDMSVDKAVSAPGHIADQNLLLPRSLFQFDSKICANESDPGGSSRTTPIGKDHLYFQQKENPHSVRPKSEVRTLVNSNLQEKRDEIDTHISPSVDLLSVLLERGNKLRNAMVVSALQSNINSDMGLKDMPLHIPTVNTGALSLLSTIPSTVQVIQHNSHSDIQHLTQDAELQRPDVHDIAVEHLLGSVNGSVHALLDEEGSLPATLSGCSSVLMDSELSDPQYDQSLLENLFYKETMANSSLDTRDDEHEQQQSLGKNARTDSAFMPDRGLKNSFYGLTVDKLSLFERIGVARVTVFQLAVPTDSTSHIPRKQSGKGRPPLPLTTRKCLYFVEYHFPLLSANNAAVKSVPIEVKRAVSSKVVGGVVKFQHRSVFSVCINDTNIKQWWDTKLNFTVYMRKSHQKNTLPIGTAQFPLCTLLQSDRLSITTSLPVQKRNEDYLNQDVGPLKVSFELAANKKDFNSKIRVKNRAACTDTQSREADIFVGRSDDEDAIDFAQVTESIYIRDRSVSPEEVQNVSQKPAQLTNGKDKDMLFHTLFMVPNGKDFHCAPLQPNVYLNSKLFGVKETIRSVVSWGQTNPTFSFVQMAPINLTSKLLERMRNNVMIIEVWLKGSSAHYDKLLGLVKLPLHQFYMSFRDPKIRQLLLQAQYPVVAVDSYMPVVDIFSGGTRGSLRVFLAMGTSRQITALQRMREEEPRSLSQLSRPVHSLDHQPTKDVNPSSYALSEDEHLFLVLIERIKGLVPLQSTIWGEADCYVKYSFPTQEEDINPDIVESQVHLKSFCTATTLCMPDPVFGHREKHVLVAPPGVPVQRLLLSSLASQGFSNGGGIQFEVWCRYYYPNVREQLVARGLLPMAKLCALVTMQRQGRLDAQLFCLPLVPVSDKSTDVQAQPSGLLEVSVQYKLRPLKRNSLKKGILPSHKVNLVVQVHRATGLKAAARCIGLQYCQEVGVNSFVTFQLSFLPENESKRTHIAARSFCPEFKHHTEFCCQLHMQRNSGESVSLAEVLQEATAIFTVYNNDARKVMNASRAEDSILGLVKIPLADLLYKRTGISGWYGLSLPPNVLLHRSLTSVGGLELSINFSHCTDRERVLGSARILGWEIVRDDEDDWDVEEKRDTSLQNMTFSIIMSRVWLPVHCLLLPGHTELHRYTYCYYRYKLYDQEAFCSDLKHPTLANVEEGVGLATVAFIGTQTVNLRVGQPLFWYLREEKLEVQVWVSFGKEKRMRPYKLDRLVGSAFVDLSALSKTSEPKQTISGVYSLFKPSTADLDGAAIRVHITLTAGPVPDTPLAQALTEEEMQLSISEEEAEDRGSFSVQSPAPVSQSREGCVSDKQQSKSMMCSAVVNSDDTFTATVSVEQAMHLRLKGCTLDERTNSASSCWVTYVTADEPAIVSTAAVQKSECPVWDHQQECRLSKELLLNPQQSLVFKIWNREAEIDRVIGFASVDLSPLLSGFQSVCGWYNVTDLSGQCQGQLKTTGVYSAFPSHISCFSKQRINTPEQGNKQLFTRSSQPHDEHMDKVRQFHKNLQQKESVMLSNCAGDTHSSSSALLSALRKNLSELDDIQKYFSCKMSTPVFSVLGERNISENQTRRSSSNTCSNPSTLDEPEVCVFSSTLTKSVNCDTENVYNKAPAAKMEDNLPPMSLTSEEPDVSDDELQQDVLSTDDENKEEDESKKEEEVEDDDYTEFEETLIEPQPLNEVTSAIDRTSPWTTVLSDPEFGSLEKIETTEQPVELMHQLEGETVMSPVVSTSKTLRNDTDSKLLSENESCDNEEEDAKRYVGNFHNVCVELIDDMFFRRDSKQDTSKLTDHDQQDVMTNSDVSNSPLSSDTEPGTKGNGENEMTKGNDKLFDAVQIPNFFLPAQHLEASMRALRLAPVFPSVAPLCGPGKSEFTDDRVTRPRPSVPPSSAKSKETKRIAKIFASHFT